MDDSFRPSLDRHSPRMTPYNDAQAGGFLNTGLTHMHACL